MDSIYHLGLVKRGNTVTLEIADTVDGLNCELWKYLGERITNIARIKRDSQLLLQHINQDFGTAFTAIRVKRIPAGDLTAGHRDAETLESVLREARERA